MPSASIQTKVVINAPVKQVFDYVSDITRHGEWSADSVQIVPLSSGPIAVGHQYLSTAQSRGITFKAEIEVTEFGPPKRFAFKGSDETGQFSHRFTFELQRDGTLVTRQTHLSANWIQTPIFLVALYPLRVFAARKALRLLKEKIEKTR